MLIDLERDKAKTYIEPIKWCGYIVNTGYVTAALIVLAHVIWYFAVKIVVPLTADAYLRDYVILPSVGFAMMTILADLLVRAPILSLIVKEYISLSLFIVFSAYLCFTHDIAIVLLASFILPIFVSTIFANEKITRWMFWMSSLSVVSLGVKLNYVGKLDNYMIMQIFVAIFMFVCSYLLAKVLIRHGHDDLSALKNFDHRHQYMQEQLKLDQFTGLYNRKTFDDYLAKFVEECGIANKFISLAMIDVDNFKAVNDLYGHAVGDRVLLYTSQILKNIRAENIHVFRMGGDEFVILFSDCDAQEAYGICEDMRKRMQAACLSEIENKKVTFSCGLVCINPKHSNLEAFAKAADFALYAAKNNGRNQTVLYDDSMQHIDQSQS